jgi:hypothetical protein
MNTYIIDMFSILLLLLNEKRFFALLAIAYSFFNRLLACLVIENNRLTFPEDLPAQLQMAITAGQNKLKESRALENTEKKEEPSQKMPKTD